MSETTLVQLNFNKNYQFDTEKSEVVRTLWENGNALTFRFTYPQFKNVDPNSTRFLTKAVKAKIEEEVHDRALLKYTPQPEPKGRDEVEEFFDLPFENPEKLPQSPKAEPKVDKVSTAGELGEIKDMFAQLMQAQAQTIALQTRNPYEEGIIQGVTEKAKEIATDDIMNTMKERFDSFVKETYGTLPQRIEIKVGDKPKKEIQGLTHHRFESILQIVSRNIPVLLVGEAGTGKNHTLEQVAKALDLEFYFTNAVTQEYKLTGFIDANGTFHETQFYKAFTQGGLFFLDEMDASIPEVLLILNSAIANRYFDFPTGRVEAHPDFRVVSASNTVGTGSDDIYTGRNQLDGASLDRFVQVPFSYDPAVEKELANNNDVYEFINASREVIKENDIRYIVSMRATINLAKLVDVLPDSDLVTMVVFKGLAEDDYMLIKERLSTKVPTNRFVKAM